ncbi:hypothetical protein K438DRAFT_2029527, partial [Mycena galopus ATCC 62051]
MSDRKICHCKPTCGRLITARTRRDHYSKVPATSIRPSVSPPPELPTDNPETSQAADNVPPSYSPPVEAHSPSPSHTLDLHDFEMHECSYPDDNSCSGSADSMDIDSASDSASSAGTEERSISSLDPDLDPWSGFDEFQDRDEPLSHAEMLQQLEEMMGPGDE